MTVTGIQPKDSSEIFQQSAPSFESDFRCQFFQAAAKNDFETICRLYPQLANHYSEKLTALNIAIRAEAIDVVFWLINLSKNDLSIPLGHEFTHACILKDAAAVGNNRLVDAMLQTGMITSAAKEEALHAAASHHQLSTHKLISAYDATATDCTISMMIDDAANAAIQTIDSLSCFE
jgi:hypothetical protein